MFKENKMSKKNKFFLAAFGLGMTAASAVWAAETNAVLYKVHDIKPVTNADGLIVACDLSATFYNRTGADIANANLDIVWQDEVVADAIETEKKVERPARLSLRERIASATEKLDSKNLTLSLNLPMLGNNKQITLNSKIRTDKCFLLLGDAEARVNNCSMNGSKEGNCKGMFQFVSVTDPQYYTEFQSLSLEEQREQEMSEQEKERREINAKFENAATALKTLSETVKVTQ